MFSGEPFFVVAAIEKTEMEIADFYVRWLEASSRKTSAAIAKGEQKMTHRRGAGREKKSLAAHGRSIYRSILKFRARAGLL